MRQVGLVRLRKMMEVRSGHEETCSVILGSLFTARRVVFLHQASELELANSMEKQSGDEAQGDFS